MYLYGEGPWQIPPYKVNQGPYREVREMMRWGDVLSVVLLPKMHNLKPTVWNPQTTQTEW